VQRRLVLRDLEIRLQTGKSVGIDAALIGESTFRNVYIVAPSGSSGTTGIVFSDGNASVSGYSNVVSECQLLQLDRGIVVLPRANDQRIVQNVIERGGVAIAIHATVNATHIVNNLVQSFTVRGIEDHGDGTYIIANRFEAAKPHIELEPEGAAAQVIANYHGGAGAAIEDRGMRDALILQTHRGGVAPGRLGNLAFDSFSYEPRQHPPSACSAARDGATYFDGGLHSMCVCDGSRSRWCALQIGGDAIPCGSNADCQ